MGEGNFMLNKFYKNDYKIKKDLKDFANNNPLGRFLKPFFKGMYCFVNPYLPYPRDFLLKMVPKNGICCEVGVYEGIFSERIWRICRPRKLYLIDPWEPIKDRTEEKYNQKYQDARYNSVSDKFSKQISDGTVVIIRETSDSAAPVFDNDFFDFIYIDGDHSYNQVKKDLNNYYPKVKPGGLLCGDDYNLEEVRQAADEFVEVNSASLQSKGLQFIIKKVELES